MKNKGYAKFFTNGAFPWPQTILKQLEEWHVFVSCDQSGETLRAASTLDILGANKVNYGKFGSGKLLPEEPQGSLLLVQREPGRRDCQAGSCKYVWKVPTIKFRNLISKIPFWWNVDYRKQGPHSPIHLIIITKPLPEYLLTSGPEES